MRRRERSPLRADHVVYFDGAFETAVSAFRNAGEEPVLFVVDGTDRNALATIGRTRASGVLTEALVHVSDLGPLGRTVLTALASSLTQQTDAGTVLAALEEIERQSRTFVVVDSPARLQRPAPSLWQHAWGLLPGTCFVGELSGRVTAVGRRGLPPAFADALRSPASVLHTTAPETVGTRREDVLAQLVDAVSPWRHVPHPPAGAASAAWWGPARPLELCAVPADVAGVVRTVRARSTACSWCGSTAVHEECAVCGSSVPGHSEEGQPA